MKLRICSLFFWVCIFSSFFSLESWMAFLSVSTTSELWGAQAEGYYIFVFCFELFCFVIVLFDCERHWWHMTASCFFMRISWDLRRYVQYAHGSIGVDQATQSLWSPSSIRSQITKSNRVGDVECPLNYPPAVVELLVSEIPHTQLDFPGHSQLLARLEQDSKILVIWQHACMSEP